MALSADIKVIQRLIFYHYFSFRKEKTKAQKEAEIWLWSTIMVSEKLERGPGSPVWFFPPREGYFLKSYIIFTKSPLWLFLVLNDIAISFLKNLLKTTVSRNGILPLCSATKSFRK